MFQYVCKKKFLQTLWVNNLRILGIRNVKFSGYYFYMNTNMNTSWRRLSYSSSENVLKTSLQDVLKTFWRRLENLMTRRLEDSLKTSWKCLEDALRRMTKTNKFILIKTSWRRMTKANVLVLIKTSSRRFLKTKTKEVFKTS